MYYIFFGSPFTRLETVLLAFAAPSCVEMHQIDVETAFHNGDLDETKYIWPLEGVPLEGGYVIFINFRRPFMA